MDLLSTLLSSTRTSSASLADFRAAVDTVNATPIDFALLAGARADRLGYAFAAGYAAALRQLLPDFQGYGALCITEAGGAHPRAIRTTLSQGRVTGEKVWSTLAGDGDALFVAASVGFDGDKNQLRLARVSPKNAILTRMPETPFTPEIPHFSVRFDAAPVEEILPGDAWETYIKPFRTVEDIHVCAAATACALNLAPWPNDVRAALLSILLTFRALSSLPPNSPSTHIALGGALASMRLALSNLDWNLAPPDVRSRWERDAPLLQVAERARAARFEAAWRRLA